MSVARRPLLTATAAGSLLCALWFVPSANATVDTVEQSSARGRTGTSAAPAPSQVPAGAPAQARDGLALADTGSVDTTPYLIGGTAFLGLGAGLVAFAVRRGAHTAL
ncbi:MULTISPECIES: hypothetical protein [unclassified Streptomyces]|uniref:hypothetical protein n=1 Tax=unclassified Streptomyces TaxID=2593676 RepID=UPI0004C6B108|nr:hypothetical protein [Streptomyces sp. NRRL S-118]